VGAGTLEVLELSRHLEWLGIVALPGAASWLAFDRPVRLGLDLRGGTQTISVRGAGSCGASRPPSTRWAFFTTFYGPTAKALAALGADHVLKTEMQELARRFDVSDDDTLGLRMYYLEPIIHKPAAS